MSRWNIVVGAIDDAALIASWKLIQTHIHRLQQFAHSNLVHKLVHRCTQAQTIMRGKICALMRILGESEHTAMVYELLVVDTAEPAVCAMDGIIDELAVVIELISLHVWEGSAQWVDRYKHNFCYAAYIVDEMLQIANIFE